MTPPPADPPKTEAPRSSCRVGDLLTVEIEKLALLGRGLARHQGMTLFVKDGVPGDRAEVRVTKRKPQYAEAVLVRLERPSPHRVTAPCAHFGRCGGCDLQHLDYAMQVAWKQTQLAETLQHLGGIRRLPPIAVAPMADPWHYRNKMELTFGQAPGRIILGLHERGSFQRIVKLDHCWIAPRLASAMLQTVEAAATASGLPAYNPRRHEGFWRYLVIRVARRGTHPVDGSGQATPPPDSSPEAMPSGRPFGPQSGGGAMVMVVTHDGPREAVVQVAQAVTRAHPEVVSVLWGVSTRVSDVAQPERMERVIGQDVLEDRVGPLALQVRPMSFVQPNLLQAELLYEEMLAAAALRGREVVYDLYCGLGVIALLAARHAKTVYGIESEPDNVALAAANAQRNGLTNTTFLCGTVEDLVVRRGLFRMGPAPDLIIVDPPRVGLHQDVIGPLLHAQAPRLFYISCNPASLARDLKAILEREPRYRLTRITLYDFFPHTGHMEVLATLER